MEPKELKRYNRRIRQWEHELVEELASCMLRGENPPRDKKAAAFGASFFSRLSEDDCCYWAMFSARCDKEISSENFLKCLSSWLILGQDRFSEICEEAKPLEVPQKSIDWLKTVSANSVTRPLAARGFRRARYACL
ncbi:MAG: hypothetical protein WCO10_00600 [bacterium]